jgi:cobalt-zinc-cadmium efflux system protein
MRHNHGPKQSSIADELFEYRSVEKKKLRLAMGITALVMVVEIVGGFLTNSLALISDAGHMFTHAFALAISLGAIYCASIESCHHRTFGFFRAEILAALFNSVFLFGATLWILYESVVRLVHPVPVLGMQMFIVALVGLVVNLATAMILHGTSRHDINIRGAFLHMLADTLSSVVIVIGAVVIYFTGWNVLDPILSIGVALVILKWGWGLFRDSVNILLESAPKGMDSDDIREALTASVQEIEEITDLHIWEITSKMYSLTAHLRLKKDVSRDGERQVLATVRRVLNEKFDIEHTTIEIE